MEKSSIIVGTGKSVKRYINHPWFVAIVGGIIVGIILYFLLEKPHIFKEIYRIAQDYITIPRIIVTACVIIIGIVLFILHRRITQIRKHRVEEATISSLISGLCIGRDTELSQLETDLAHKNVLLIKGIPGIGKTTLGLKFRDILEEKGYQTLWYQCDFESYEGFLIFLSDYLKNRGSITFQSLRDQGISLQERLKTAVQELCAYPTVLFLDKFQEFKRGSDFGIFRDHLRNSTLVVMSRVQPTFLLESSEDLLTLDKNSSLDLLKTLEVKESPKILEKIYEKTKGHPWSLVRFADFARVLPVRNLLDELPDFGRDQEEYVNEECWRHLKENERDFLMRASVFTKPLDFEALEVCSKKGILSEVLFSLARRFYVEKREEYYYIHDIIKDFALSKLKENSGLYVKAERAAADYYRRSISAENLLLVYYHLKEAGSHKAALDSIIKGVDYFWREGYWEDVRGLLEESLDFFEEDETRVDIYYCIGMIVYKLSEWDTAIDYYQKSLDIFEKIEDIHGMAATYNNLGLVYADKGEWDTAIDYYQKSLEIRERIEDIHGMARTYNNLGMVYYKKGEWDTAIDYYQKSLDIFEKIGDIHGISQTYGNLGLAYHSKGEWDTTIDYYQKSLEIKEKLGDIHGISQTYCAIGMVYYRKGEWDTAIKYHEKSLNIFEKIGDIQEMARTYCALGLVYADKGEWDTAIKYHEKNLEIKEKIGDIYEMAMTYNNLGSVYADKGEWDTAIDYYQKSLEISEKIGDIHGMAITWESLAEAYCGKDDIDTALDFCNNSFETFKKIGDKLNLADVHRAYGIIFRKRKELQKSKEELEKSIEIYQEFSMIYELAKTFYELAVTLLEIGDTKNAREYFIRALEIFKELNVNHHIKKVEDQLKSM